MQINNIFKLTIKLISMTIILNIINHGFGIFKITCNKLYLKLKHIVKVIQNCD